MTLSFRSQMIICLYDFLLLLIVYPCHTFSQLLMTIIRGICGHIKASWDNHSNCLSYSSCSRLSMCSVCETWTADVWDLADRHRLYSSRRSTVTWKRLAKKKKVVQLDWSDDSSTRDGITTPHGSTDGGRPHIGGIFTDGRSIHSLPGTSHLHQAPANQSPVSGHPGTHH